MITMKWINTVAFLAMVSVNVLSNLLLLGGKTTGQISDAYPNLFTPVGMTFSIWGVIYLLMGIFVLYQWGLFGSVEESDKITAKIDILFVISCIFNILWILCWHSDAIGWSVFCIAGLLVTLVFIQLIIQPDSSGVTRRIAVNAGFDIYFGWIIVATIANISVWLVKIEWDRFGLSDEFWTTVILLVGAAIGMCVVLIGQKRLAGCSLIWAYIGILIKHLSDTGHSSRYPIIIAAIILSIMFILASVVISSIYAFLKFGREQYDIFCK